MRYERVKIARDNNTVHNRAMPPWEIPVVEFIFDEGNIERLEVFETVEKDYPDATVELDRLVRCYGSDPKSGVAYANSVFGNARAGVRSLQKMIDEAKKADAEDAEKPAAPVVSRKRRASVETDSLLS